MTILIPLECLLIFPTTLNASQRSVAFEVGRLSQTQESVRCLSQTTARLMIIRMNISTKSRKTIVVVYTLIQRV